MIESKKIDYLLFAKKLLANTQVGDKGRRHIIERCRKLSNNSYQLDEVRISKIENGWVSVVFVKTLRLHHCYYPFRFSFPRNNLIKYESLRSNDIQSIEITEWAHTTFYVKALNEILEKHGKYLYFLISNYDHIENNPIFKHYKESKNFRIIRELKKKSDKQSMQNTIAQLKEKMGGDLF